MTSNAPKPRTKKPVPVTDTAAAAIEDAQEPSAARRIFKGSTLPVTPSFALESAADPSNVVEFVGIPALPGMMALELVVDGVSMDTVPTFFTEVLGDAEYERFREFVDLPENGITLDVLISLAKYLIAEYTGRPTEEPTGS